MYVGWGVKRKVIFTEECQLINVDKRIKTEKSPFENDQRDDWFNQESSAEAKTVGWKTAAE